MSTFKRLSYVLGTNVPTYGNGPKPEISKLADMDCGDTANKHLLKLDNHTGTHIDFPRHFIADGRSGDQFAPEELIFNNVQVIETDRKSGLITIEDLAQVQPSVETDFLIIKTGMCHHRETEDYWNNNPGFAPDTAAWLREQLPNLKCIGFDSISLSSYQNRPEGRIAHREYLSREILILEDMDLRDIASGEAIDRLMVAPTLFEQADGAWCYVIAEMKA